MTTKSGYIAVVGRPNVGKSTLLNTLLNQKVAITSKKPQTTRHQILGIKTDNDTQFLFVDTPGLHTAEQRAMNRVLNRAARSALQDVDVVLWLVEASRFTEEDAHVFSLLKDLSKPVILVLSKVDLLSDKSQLLPLIESLTEQYAPEMIIPVSATKQDNLEVLLSEVKQYLPEAPFYFEPDQVTDKTDKFRITEIIREKLIRNTAQELPYATTVEIEDWQKEKSIDRISVIIWVERSGQKTIVIGKSGEKLKKIGTQARQECEVLLGKKVFLRLWVKVKEDWSNNDKLLRELGYNA